MGCCGGAIKGLLPTNDYLAILRPPSRQSVGFWRAGAGSHEASGTTSNAWRITIALSRRRPVIFITSNKSFANGARSSATTVLATAILDRLLHHCDVINTNGTQSSN